jgi:flagellar hook-length control protein FliK
MQINPFGYPLGAGMQSASAIGGTGLGFADALGVAIEGGAPQLIGLKASATPPRILDAKLSQTLLAQAQLETQPMSATAALPGLQQPTSLSELMATAAKLPTAEPVTEVATPDVPPAGIAVEVAPELSAPAAPQPATPAPVKADSLLAQPIPQPEGEALPEVEALPEAPETVTPAEAASAKPSKSRARGTAVEAEPAQPSAAQPAVPAQMLVAAVATQPITQSQGAAREFGAASQGGTTVSTGKKAALAGALAADSPQTASTTSATTAGFAHAVAAQGESPGSDSNTDGQSQPEVQLAAAKHDAAAPAVPTAAHVATVDSVRAAAGPAAAEPLIEARAGHLGHSLGVEIARKVELGEETLRIRLNPVELGRIEVTLAFDDKGSLQATVRTESAQAMDLLRQDAPDLARTLDQAGVRTDAQSFRFENRGGDSGGQQAQQQQQNRGQFASSDDDAAIAEPIYRPIRSDGQVDLLA